MGESVGQVLVAAINGKRIPQTRLCRGLCTQGTFSRYVNGERNMDRLLTSTIMQRAGVSPDKYSSLLSGEEYRYHKWRKSLCEAYRTGDWNAVEKLLEHGEARDGTCNEALQKQYYLMICGIVQDKLYGNRAAGAEMMKEALKLTTENSAQFRKACFSIHEAQLVLLWLKFCRGEKAACEYAGKMLEYVETHFADRQERCKLYSVLTLQIFPCLYGMGEYEKCACLTGKALKMIREIGRGDCATFILADYLKAADKLGKTERGNFCQRQLETYCELEKANGYELQDRDTRLFSLDVRQEVFLIQELVADSRKRCGMSQEQLAEIVECTAKTLSRIETGKNAPGRRQYRVLAEKLGLPKDFLFSELETERHEILEAAWNAAMNVVNKNWQEVEKSKKYLEEQLDMSIACNQQYCKSLEHILAEVNGENGAEYSFEAVVKLLRISLDTMPEGEDVTLWDKKFWQGHFSKTELFLLIYLADILAAKGKRKQAAYVLERLLEKYYRSKVEPEAHYFTALPMLKRLSSEAYLANQYEERMKYADEGVRMSLSCGYGKLLPALLYHKADILEKLGQRKKAAGTYQQAYYMATFFMMKEEEELSSEACFRLTGERPE